MIKTEKYRFHLSRVILLFLFAAYYCSINMFYHIHLVNGKIISHSHPYNHSSKPNHSHSHNSNEYLLIDHLNKALWQDNAEIPQLPQPISYLFELVQLNKENSPTKNYYTLAQLRAPPFSL